MIIKLAAIILTVLLALVVGFNVWGVATQGSLVPALNAERDTSANRVVMVFGASGSAGGGLLKAAVEDNEVEKVYVVTRRSTDYIAAAAEDSDKVSVIMHKNFTDYTGLENELVDVSTVLWALGTSSLNVDEATYTLIHVDFPAAFVRTWLSARQAAGNIDSPMAYHFIAGMGTYSSDAAWRTINAKPNGMERQWLRALVCARLVIAQPIYARSVKRRMLVIILLKFTASRKIGHQLKRVGPGHVGNQCTD